MPKLVHSYRLALNVYLLWRENKFQLWVTANFVMKNVTDTCTSMDLSAQNAWCPPSRMLHNLYKEIFLCDFC